MISLSSTRIHTLMMLFLLLAAFGLASSFVMDALCGSVIITEHECQERQIPGADVLADCCCTHPSFVPLTSAIPSGDLPLALVTAMAQPRLVSAALQPLFHPPV